MRKFTCVIVSLLLLITCITGCKENTPPEIQTENISIGVIETKGDKDTSRIIFYDSDMNELGALPLEYATVGNIFYSPLVIDDTLYVIPQGQANKKDAKTVLEISLSNLEIKTHTIAQLAMNSVAANERFVYTCNTFNGISYINKCNRNTGKTESIDIPATYISKLLFVKDRLYAFGTIDTENVMHSELYVYDEDLNLLDKTDISKYGANQYKALEQNGNIYFTSLTDQNDNPISTVGVFNTSDFSVEKIQLTMEHPLDLAIHDGKLYVTHFNVVQLIGGGLSVYNLETGEVKDYTFEHGAEQMLISNGYLHILSDWKIYRYDLSDMELIKCVDVSKMDNSYSYLSGIFALEN